jgi:hypothetical protein
MVGKLLISASWATVLFFPKMTRPTAVLRAAASLAGFGPNRDSSPRAASVAVTRRLWDTGRAMSTQSLPDDPIRTGRLSTWLTARELWGGLAVVSMWLAVLFVGVFGGSIQTSNPPNNSSVPVVVVVALFAVLGTVVVARRAFVASPTSNDLRRAIEDERQAREQLAAEVADLRAKLSS